MLTRELLRFPDLKRVGISYLADPKASYSPRQFSPLPLLRQEPRLDRRRGLTWFELTA